MNFQNLFNEFTGSGNKESAAAGSPAGFGETLGKLGEKIPGGLAGGAAAGGIMALLMTNKSARKFAGKAAGYGGTALLGGLAYKAFSNWQHNKGNPQAGFSGSDHMLPDSHDNLTSSTTETAAFQQQLIKAMIAAARADGHIDAAEHKRIFDAVREMKVSSEVKALLFELLEQPITIDELTMNAQSIEQKSEIYLASLLVIDPDHRNEEQHLIQLAAALDLPEGLPEQLHWQVQNALA